MGEGPEFQTLIFRFTQLRAYIPDFSSLGAIRVQKKEKGDREKGGIRLKTLISDISTLKRNQVRSGMGLPMKIAGTFQYP
jgi:hypothetical protein